MGITPNIIEIIKRELELHIEREVDEMEKEIIKKLHERIPEIVAKTAVEIALEPSLMEMGNIIRFDIGS